MLFPTNKFSLELNAAICKIVFAWMVGPMEVESTTENDLGEMIASKVRIKKCRMCKTATKDFFRDDFGHLRQDPRRGEQVRNCRVPPG